MSGARTPRAGTTTAAAVIMFVLTGLWALLGFGLTIVGIAVDNADLADDLDTAGNLADVISGILLGIGIAVLAMCAWVIVLGVNVLGRKGWARVGAIVTFSIFTLLALLGLSGSFGTDAETDGTGYDASPVVTLLGVALNAGVVVLLVVRSTKDDFAQAEAAARGGGWGYGQGYPGVGQGQPWGAPTDAWPGQAPTQQQPGASPPGWGQSWPPPQPKGQPPGGGQGGQGGQTGQGWWQEPPPPPSSGG